jgi:hypothetical protein
MEILQLILLIVGGIIILWGSIWFLVECFRESVWWLLGCLLFTPLQLVFLILYWGVAKKPFGLQLLGFAMVFFSMFLTDPDIFNSY